MSEGPQFYHCPMFIDINLLHTLSFLVCYQIQLLKASHTGFCFFFSAGLIIFIAQALLQNISFRCALEFIPK